MRLPILIAALTLAAAAPAHADDYPAGSETASSGAVTATLAWDAGDDGPANLRLTVARGGATAFQAPIPRVCGEDCGRWADDPGYFKLADFQGDGEPEVFVRTFMWSDCCETFGIYTFDAATGGYREFVRDRATWVEAEDVDGDGATELVTADPRFQGLLGGRLPIQILVYDGSGLRDVTREHPRAIRADARAARAAILDEDQAEAALATYVADQHLLGKGRAAIAFLDRRLARGVVDAPRAYRSKLLRALRRHGYR